MDKALKFENFIFETFRNNKARGYSPNQLFSLIQRQGALETAKRLINAPMESEGYTKLQLANRLDLTIEALVCDNSEWHALFTPKELDICRLRLAKVNYPKDQ